MFRFLDVKLMCFELYTFIECLFLKKLPIIANFQCFWCDAVYLKYALNAQ